MNYSTEEMFVSNVIHEEAARYVGKTKYLEEAEKELNKLIVHIQDENPNGFIKSAVQNVKSIRYAMKSKINISPEIEKVSRLMEKQFGFKEFVLGVLPVQLDNAFNYPKPMIIRDHQIKGMPTLHHPDGSFYDKTHSYIANSILFDSLFHGKYTGGEILALLLHEIGHQFDISATSYFNTFFLLPFNIYYDVKLGIMTKYLPKPFQIALDVLQGYLIPMKTHVIPKLFKTSAANQRQMDPRGFAWNSLIQTLLNKYLMFDEIYERAKNLTKIVTKPISYLMDRFPTILPLKIANALTFFNAERFSDSFATVYGYGPELISALRKLDGPLLQGNFVIENAMFVIDSVSGILNMILDPHPETQTRCRMIVDDMKKLSENPNYSPKMRKALKAKYEESKAAYDKYIGIDDKEKKWLASTYAKMLKEKIGGKIDIRALIFRSSAVQGKLIAAQKYKK